MGSQEFEITGCGTIKEKFKFQNIVMAMRSFLLLCIIEVTLSCGSQREIKHQDVIGSCPVNTDKLCTQEYPKNFGNELTGETIEELRKIARSTPNELKLGDWQRVLTPEQFKVTRLNCTELRNTSPLNNVHERGIFHCVNCDNPLFDFQSKFDSGSGWPSFFQPIREDAVDTTTDYHIGYARTEVRCAKCGAHLGHMFSDGPPPTGLRYCINGVALEFVKALSP